MSTNPSNSPRRLPTVSELLENPTVRALTERLNRNAVVAGVKSFVDDLRNDLVRRDSSHWPSLRDLAELAARHVESLSPSQRRIVINATGQVWGGQWLGRPQSDAALQQAFMEGREFILAPETAKNPSPCGAELEALICRQTGAQAAAVVHSYVGAVWLAIAALGAGREIIVGRGEVGELDDACTLAEVATSAGASLRDVGAANRTVAADYETSVCDRSAAILRVHTERYSIVGAATSVELDELVAIARDRELLLIDAIGTAALDDLSTQISWAKRSARASLSTGVNLVIVRGDGLSGGPACGFLAGDEDCIRRISRHPLFAAFMLDPPRAAALAATLRPSAGAGGAEGVVPLVSLLAAPLDNLRNRAERIAVQLAHADGIAAAEAVAVQSYPEGVCLTERAAPSFGVALTPANGGATALAHRLATRWLPIIGRIDGDRVLLDLRTVPPRHDSSIVRALAGDQPLADEAVASTDPALAAT